MISNAPTSDASFGLGTDEVKRAAFDKIFKQIMTRMNAFVNLPMHMLDKQAVQREIKKIGDIAVATTQ